ncbi:hypothetical protein CIW49_26690 [Mycolicibacterium sp. P1-18]|nr:hypothetical protein CIW49_26690 [Mycolicibacterium sp. P1-18]
MASTPARAIDLARQLVAIRTAIPAARGRINRGQLDCVVPIQPGVGSETYSARIQYRHWKPPRVHVVEPTLALHPGETGLPHVYPGDRLCLYYPGEWQHTMLLSRTILPWTAEWLLHYEIWLATGEWTGGGYHPARPTPTKRPG